MCFAFCWFCAAAENAMQVRVWLAATPMKFYSNRWLLALSHKTFCQVLESNEDCE
jgi:hypothetical protein